MGFSGSDLLEDPHDLLGCDPGTRMEGPVVLVVTDVLVSSFSLGTKFCDDVSVSLIGNLLNRSRPLSPKSARWIGRFRRKR